MQGDDFRVTQMGDGGWGRVSHRKISVDHCANGFIVEYEVVRKKKRKKPDEVFGDYESSTRRERAVFHNIKNLLEFVSDYFGEVQE